MDININQLNFYLYTMLAKVLDYNQLFEKGLSFICALSSDNYLDDIAEKSGFQDGTDFIDELNSIWYESYKQGFNNPTDTADSWSLQIQKLNTTLDEVKKIASYDRKKIEANDRSEAKKLLDSIYSHVAELELFYDANNHPLYDIASIQSILNNEKDKLLQSRGKKNRKLIYNRMLDAIESARFQ